MSRGRHRKRRDLSPYKPVATASAAIFAVTGIAIGSVMIADQAAPSADRSKAPLSIVEIPPLALAPGWSGRASNDRDLQAEVMPKTSTPKPAPTTTIKPPVVPPPALKRPVPPPAPKPVVAPPPPPPAPKPPPPPAPVTVSAKIGIGAGWQAQWAVIHAAFPAATLNSGQRCTDAGYHCKGRAIDIGGSPALMLQIDRWIAANYPNSTELIHGPGINIYMGGVVNGVAFYGSATMGQHYNHVHWAM